jgi:NADPH:quinone reductase-like Zn-dependent oxidoreductase
MPDTVAQATMHAIAAREWGGPDVLEYVTVPRPKPRATEILVAVHAAGVNPTDWKGRATGGFGQYGEPAILGHDVAGVVEAVGHGVRLFQPGDEVFGMPHFPGAGAYAEYVTAPARHFAPKPAGLSHAEAAGLPLVGLTAWQALADIARVRPGQRVLVHAAAGGVGHVAVQVAKALGAHVIGTASASKHEFLRSLGADELIDYRDTDFADVVADVDAVIDTIGGDYTMRSLSVLRRGGVLIELTRPTEPEVAARARELDVSSGWMLVEPDHAGLLALAELVDEGKLRVEVSDVVPLAEAARAHELGESNRTTGKLVLQVR